MSLQISFVESASKANGKPETLVFLVADDKKLDAAAVAADKASGGQIARALKSGRKFKANAGQCLTLHGPAGLACERVVLMGVGKPSEMDEKTLETIAGGLVAQLNALGAGEAAVTIALPKTSPIASAKAAAHMGFAALLRSYRFDKYRTTEKTEDKPTLKKLTLHCTGAKQAAAAFAVLEKIAEGVIFTRNLVSEPGNIIHPESLADKCRELTKLGVKIDVLGEPEMRKLGMGALLGVGQGSEKESRLVVMQWLGSANKKQAPVALVGKGVTFDSGGISIKPSGGMEEMKWDMGGAGAVIGTMRALAGRKAKANVVGIVGLVENMPDGNAQRPGDVVTSMSGQTIEVINTDAEGRLVLSDALWYTQERFRPRLIVDLATLTGAIIIALGNKKAGLFSNDDTLAKQLAKAGDDVGEELWRMPLGDYYDKLINSDIADMKNSVETREAGSTTAAQFLQRFIKKGTPWAHLDIAGTAWSKKDQPSIPKGATAFGVRLLERFIAENYET